MDIIQGLVDLGIPSILAVIMIAFVFLWRAYQGATSRHMDWLEEEVREARVFLEAQPTALPLSARVARQRLGAGRSEGADVREVASRERLAHVKPNGVVAAVVQEPGAPFK